MGLRERVESLIRPQAPTVIPPMTPSTSELARMERMIADRRWLRGAMCFLAVICFVLSLFDEGRVVTHFFILTLSLAGEVAIVCIYRVEAKLHGITNRVNGKRREVSVFHSPSLATMLLEMLLWIIQCPPVPDSMAPDWLVGLDGLLALRFYVLVLYGTNVSHAAVFSRAVASLAHIRLNHWFFIRTAFLLEHPVTTLCAIAVGVVTFTYSYANAEGVRFGDSFYFCVSTASLAGSSEASPVTLAGRVIAVLVTLFGVFLLCWMVGVMNHALSLTGAERNLYALFRSNELCDRVPAQAARLIQRAWRLYVAKRDGRNLIARQIAAFILSREVITYRDMRRELMGCETPFLPLTCTFKGSMRTDSTLESSGTTPCMSSVTTPLGTPRARRPCHLFQETRMKESSRPQTPCGHEYREKGGAEMTNHRGEGNRTEVAATVPSARQQPVRPLGPSVEELELRLSMLGTTLERLAATAERLQGSFGRVSV